MTLGIACVETGVERRKNLQAEKLCRKGEIVSVVN